MATKETGIGPYAIFAGLGVLGGAYLWSRAKKITPRPPLVNKVGTAKSFKDLTPEQKTQFVAALKEFARRLDLVNRLRMSGVRVAIKGADKSRMLSGVGLKIIPKPEVFTAKAFRLDQLRSEGLLGKLVANNIATERARIMYMSRCSAVAWDDDTPAYMNGKEKWISESAKNKLLADKNGYGAVVREDAYEERFNAGSSSKYDKSAYRKRYSLERTFSNWSAPYWGDWCYNRFPFNRKPYRNEDIKKNIASGDTKWARFTSGNAKFHEFMVEALGSTLFHSFTLDLDDVKNFDAFPAVRPSSRSKIYAIPWRAFNGPGYSDRVAATYKLSPVLGSMERTAKAVDSYYRRGYYIVRSALDILCEKGLTASSFEGFAEHCTWWMIPQPTQEFLEKNDDLSFIGGGSSGIAGIDLKKLIKYVIEITPKPGTIAPWEDSGPLWGWPDTTGYMAPMTSLPVMKSRTDVNNKYAKTFKYLWAVEMAVCDIAGAGGMSNIVLDMAVDWAVSTCADWIGKGLSEIVSNLEKVLSSPAFHEAQKIISEVSSGIADVDKFLEVQYMALPFDGAANLPKALDDYLSAAVDGVGGSRLNILKDTAQSQIDNLRRNWSWSDDLLGYVGSTGTNIRSKFKI